MATADQQQFASFIMCIGADFSSKLWIPAKFVRKYRQIANQASVMVESDDGRFWEVGIEDINGELLIKDGWSEVVKNNNISELDFLTFRLLGDSTFKLSIYTSDCCPRDPPPPPISGGGDEMSNKTPSFLKALSNTDFTKILRVPPVFIEKYGLTPPENAKLRVRNSGRTWDVKVERLPENGLFCFCFTKGWQIFAEDARLQLNEFLVLSLVREWEFNVVIYDTDDMCEREIADGTNVKRERHKYRCFDRSDPLYFEVCMRPYHRSRISLGMKFVKAAGFGGRKSVMVKHVEKRICISVAIDHRPQACRVDLARGWSDFREANGLEPGKTYSFRFDPIKDLILVNEIKKRN